MKSLLLAVVFLAACQPANVFYVDSRLTEPNQRAAVQLAVDFWNGTGVTDTIDLVFDHDVNDWEGKRTIRIVENRADNARLNDARQAAGLPRNSTFDGANLKEGTATTRSETIFISIENFHATARDFAAQRAVELDPEVSTWLLKREVWYNSPGGAMLTTIRHELGHHFDLDHVADPLAIMAADINPDAPGCLRPDDVRQIFIHVEETVRPQGVCK